MSGSYNTSDSSSVLESTGVLFCRVLRPTRPNIRTLISYPALFVLFRFVFSFVLEFLITQTRPYFLSCYSDEDTDVKALVKSWLLSQPEEDRRMLETFLEDHFYKALDWVLKQNEFVVETSLVGVVMNGLSHMHGVKVKQEFACALIKGLGANLSSTAKTAFAKEVCILLEPLLYRHLNCLDFVIKIWNWNSLFVLVNCFVGPKESINFVSISTIFLPFKVFHWTHEMPPDQKRPLDTYYDSDRGRLASYQLEVRRACPSFSD